jgi:cell division protease FtsH
MSGIFWSTPPPPPPPPETNILFYLVIFWIIIKIFDTHSNNSFGKITRKVRKWKEETKKKFGSTPLDEVVGLEGVKEEIKYYMDFINNKKKYSDWEVKLPKGILLAGPPGTGKTLLVKKMAQTLDIPIISEAGSSFVEMYVGVGARRVRDLFKKAKKEKRCIIFIDELDAVGSKRNLERNSERASTLNQLLVEMDGFEASDNIMVFAATNLVKYLDPALLRSGRFDKKIYFDPPNFSERKSMFEMYLEDIKLPAGLSYAILSERTAGMTGADIANIANQSKINAIQRGQEAVELTDADIQIAIDEVMIGREKRERMMSDEEKERVSYHEAGHAFMGYVLKGSEPPVKVSIVPRGESALGFSQPKPANKKLYTRQVILAQISVLLGGRMAEKLIYGDVSTGAADDIEKVSNFIKLYNTSWGMSKEIGPLNPQYMGVIGENIAESVFAQCKIMVDEIEAFTFSTLKKHKKLIEKVAKDLLKNETIVYDRIKELLPNRLENSLKCDYE